MEVSTIGLDIAKNVFHLVGQNRAGKVVLRKQLRRTQVLRYFAQREACVVGIEACAGAHYWARELEKLGHEVRLVPTRAVKAYVHGAKNDYNDAHGICEAVSRPSVRLVAVKSVADQDLQTLHRLREATKRQRTALANRVRGLLMEYGIVLAQGLGNLRRGLPEILEQADNGLSDEVRALFAQQREELMRLDEHMREFDQRLVRKQREYEPARRLGEIHGVGPVLASALPARMGDARQFASGRGLAACIGLVPHQHSTGGQTRLLGISKRGDPYLRSLFINGARSVLKCAPGRDDRLSRWALGVQARRGFNVAVVALANKLARIAWAVLAKGERFDIEHA